MNIDLTDKHLLITGGTRGIGRVISLTAARAGARVAALYRHDQETAEQTLAELNALPGSRDHLALQADIAEETEAIQAVKQVGERFGGTLDFVVLDAAAGATGPLAGMTSETWRRAFDVNVHGAFYVLRASIPLLRQGGSIVFLSSGAGHDPIEGLSSYGASKAAVNQMASVLAQEVGPQGVRVNVVSPGHTEKDETAPSAHPENWTPQQKNIVETTALRRLGTSQDVANVVLFFLSDLSGFVTGQWIRVNGGRV